MTRDEVLLATLSRGESSSAALAVATGLSERTCRYGLRHLIGAGYVWSPERGRYRLTGRGLSIAAELAPNSPKTASEAIVSAPDLADVAPDAPEEGRKLPLPWLVGRSRRQ